MNDFILVVNLIVDNPKIIIQSIKQIKRREKKKHLI